MLNLTCTFISNLFILKFMFLNITFVLFVYLVINYIILTPKNLKYEFKY